ncbi:MAG TPA: glycosyl hydrolase [Polyangia bacterium]|jgi:hypothetical protein
MLRRSAFALVTLACVGGVSCARAAAEEPAPTATTGGKAALLARLGRLNGSTQFLFGEENATVWGMYLDGGLVSTKDWYERTARAGRFTSDSAALVGDDPAVLGISLGMLAFEPLGWNRRPVIAAAVRHQLAEGGVVTMDWHAPSCDSDAHATGPLGTVTVDGHDVVIQSLAGGASFYAEEEYRHPITSRADVPEPLKCVCQIANDLPLTAGTYQGLTGKTWLIAQAKYAARVMRDEKLSGLPIIVRPFHEHTGSWFWWGEPYWNCAALLDRPDAISGAAAFKAMNRVFIEALRAEPGMEQLVFAYSPDKLTGPGDDADARRGEEDVTSVAVARHKLADPTGFARDRLRDRMVRELRAAGLAYDSPLRKGATMRAARATSVKTADAYVAQRRPFYAEGYAGDDLFDVLGIDLYHPVAHPGDATDLRQFGLLLRVVAAEARARGKPYALTEAGTYRLQLAQLDATTPRGQPLTINGKPQVDEALARLFDPGDRAALLRHFGLRAPGPVILRPTERTAVVARGPEDWFNQQLLPLARQAKVAYALVWQTYYESSWRDRYFFYYVPYPGHPAANGFRRFHDDPATCFLRDGDGDGGACGR